MPAQSVIERYVGVPYVPGVFDCADLVMQFQREVYGREVHLPQDRARPTSYYETALTISAHKHSIARRRPLAEMQDGDGVLLARGCAHATHVGVVVLTGTPPEWYVLHNASEKVASVLTLMRDLPLHGWRVEGVYEWI